MSDLIVLQRNYILGVLQQIETPHGIKFLVIDRAVKQMFEYLFNDISELLSHVTAVDVIDDPKRKGQSSSEVIYLLEPTRYNINCIDADFSNRPPKYKAATIRFLSGFTDKLMSFLESKNYIKQYLRDLGEIKIAFTPKESQYFETLIEDSSMQLFYNKNCLDLVQKNAAKIVQSLINVCVVTGEYPIIRYSEPNPESFELNPGLVIAKKIAFEFQEALDQYARDNTNFPPPSSRPRSVFLITDRSLDLFSPIIHDFNYQSMAYDLVDSLDDSTDIYHYDAETETGEFESKQTKIRELNDPDWYDLRHQHIIDAKEQINSKINSLVQANPLLVDRSNVKTTTDLLSVVAHLKNFDEERRRYTIHRTLIDECLKINEERNLAPMSDFEQIVSGFGQDFDGTKVKHLAEKLITELLVSPKPAFIDKVRYIILYALYRGGLIEQDFIKLLTFIGVDKEHTFFQSFMSTISNFQYLGFPMIKATPKSKGIKKEWHHETIINDSSIYNTARFIPAVGNNLSKIITNSLLLSDDGFPYVKDKPIEIIDNEQQVPVQPSNITSSSSLRNPRHKAAWSIRKNTDSKSVVERQRFFYYVIGGISRNELKAAYDQSNLKNRDVFIGSEYLLTPMDFMREIGSLTYSRPQLCLKADERKRETAPEFLYDQVRGSTPGMGHVHIKQTQPPKNNSGAPSVKEDEPTKEKKRSRFKKLFK